MNRRQRRAAGTSKSQGTQDQGPPSPDIGAVFADAFQYHQVGHLPEAEQLYRRILQTEPAHSDSLHMLGIIAHQVGRNDTAVALIGKAIEANSGVPAYHSNIGIALYTLGRFDEAAKALGIALRLKPDLAEARTNLGNALKELGRTAEATAEHRAALRLKPDFAQAHVNLGNALKESGQKKEAIAAYDLAVCLKPDFAEAYTNRGVALYELRRLVEATVVHRAALRLKPDYAEAHSNLANALNDLGGIEEALSACRTAICLMPDFAKAYSNLGNTLKDLGRQDAATAAYGTALRLKRDFAEAFANRGVSLHDLGRNDEAVMAQVRALCLRPDYAEAHTNLGNALKDRGQIDEAICALGRAIRLKPGFAEAHSNLIMSRHYQPGISESAILETARCFARNFETGLSGLFSGTADPDRRLRIGYVSGDFRRHPVGYFLSRILINHDPEAVAIFCYSNNHQEDDLTLRLRGDADHWRGLVGLSDHAAAAVVAADEIDILVDLSGHTALNRLPVFALKPAPLQLTWLGYWGTTGLAAMDYILSDAVTIPPGEEAFYSERVLRLPRGRFCYDPPDYAPRPARRAGPVAFGSFNNINKVGPDVVHLWARVLKAVPGSRLVLKWRSLGDKTMLHRVRDSFAAQGIDPDRLDLRGHSPHAAMLGEYADIDIALDPFPFSGGLTSCEALWMGVPIITLRGVRAVSRQTEGFLRTLELASWIAATQDDYVRIAATLAEDRDALQHWRATLRPRMEASTLCDGGRFTRDLEHAYRSMWRNWCASGPT